jgi:DNA-binding response OmpR family regulator
MVPEDRKAMRLQVSPTPIDPTVQAIMVPGDHQLVVTRMDWMFFRSLVPRTVDLGTAVVDFNRCVVIRNGKKIKITHQELRLLALLCHEVGSVVPFLILESQVCHMTSGARRSVDTFKAMLGKKLGMRIGCISRVGLFIDRDQKVKSSKRAA